MRGKKTNMNDVVLKMECTDPDTLKAKLAWDNSLRILARIIAKAYMKDLAENKRQQETIAINIDRELSNPKSEKLHDKENSNSKIDTNDLLEKRLALTVHESAELLGLKNTSVYQAVKTGQIPRVKFGKRIVIPRESLIEILSRANTSKN